MIILYETEMVIVSLQNRFSNVIFITLFSVLLFFNADVIAQADINQWNNRHKEPDFPKPKEFANSTLTFKIINNPDSTYGYDLYSDNWMMIHQPSIPCMPGQQGFKNVADAEHIAKLVITKIKKGEMPPSITIEELNEIKAIELSK